MIKTFTAKEIESGKNMALASHLTILGCMIVIFMNIEPKNKYTGFYIKQTFGLHLMFYVFAYFVGNIDSLFATVPFYICFIVLWFYSFLGSVQGEIRVLPGIGGYFQKWFDKLSA
ncbi:hypothetical protein [Myroides sp. DW712]|uniref:hypothetical protein n=1 Tax=Myroides sp. DW712 TaxID=3389800 RepID=UPI00397D2E53